VITVAAVGDVHLDADLVGRFRPALRDVGEQADVLLLAGDLTRHGTEAEAVCVATEFGGLDVPVIAVLGNHDYHSGQERQVTRVLEDVGITVLEGRGVTVDCAGTRLGIAGVKGFGGGFAGRCVTAFGESLFKDFVRETERGATALETALRDLDADVRIALTHYAPVPDTLFGEPLEIYPFLGAYQLGEAIDRTDVALAVHGHAHYGSPDGITPGGVHVRNVAYPVIRRVYGLYGVDPVALAGAA